jgi:hypothetical protein
MPHVILTDSQRHALTEVVDLAVTGGSPLLRVHRTASGDAVAMANSDLMRDGLPLCGNLTLIPWGSSAVLRVRQLRVEIRWLARSEPRWAPPGQRCRLCFGAFAADESAVACSCEAAFHRDCELVRLTCPACGAPKEAIAG